MTNTQNHPKLRLPHYRIEQTADARWWVVTEGWLDGETRMVGPYLFRADAAAAGSRIERASRGALLPAQDRGPTAEQLATAEAEAMARRRAWAAGEMDEDHGPDASCGW